MTDHLHAGSRIFYSIFDPSTTFIKESPVNREMVRDLLIVLIKISNEATIRTDKGISSFQISPHPYGRFKLHGWLSDKGGQRSCSFCEKLPRFIVSSNISVVSKVQADVPLLVVEKFMMEHTQNAIG